MVPNFGAPSLPPKPSKRQSGMIFGRFSSIFNDFATPPTRYCYCNRFARSPQPKGHYWRMGSGEWGHFLGEVLARSWHRLFYNLALWTLPKSQHYSVQSCRRFLRESSRRLKITTFGNSPISWKNRLFEGMSKTLCFLVTSP